MANSNDHPAAKIVTLLMQAALLTRHQMSEQEAIILAEALMQLDVSPDECAHALGSIALTRTRFALADIVRALPDAHPSASEAWRIIRSSAQRVPALALEASRMVTATDQRMAWYEFRSHYEALVEQAIRERCVRAEWVDRYQQRRRLQMLPGGRAPRPGEARKILREIAPELARRLDAARAAERRPQEAENAEE